MDLLPPLPAMFDQILGSDEDAWPLEASLLAAAYHGNVRRIKELARSLDEEGVGIAATVGKTAFRGLNALHAASGNSNLPVYRYLVGVLGMDVNKPDATPSKKTPLDHAMAGGNIPIVRYLLDHGADVNHESEKTSSVLHRAATKGRSEIVKLLLSRGAHVDGKSEQGTPLHYAAIKGFESTVKVLLEYNADPNKVVASCLATPLAAALTTSSLSCVKLLIKAGADVNDMNNPLARAAESGLTEAIKCLLEAGANPNTPDTYGRLPIEVAAVYGTREEVEILFPLTTPIPTVADWSVDGIISHAKLEVKQQEDDDFVKGKSSDLKQKGDDAFNKLDYTNASMWYTQALKVDPSDARLLSSRSLCWLHMGDGEKALEDATRCQHHHPNWSEAYHRRGEALMLLKEYEEACETFSRGLELDPENDEMDKLFWEAMDLKK